MTPSNTEFGFIYIRSNEWYNKYDICKLGKTTNIPDRDATYITGEVERGNFNPIFRVDIYCLDRIEKELQNEFMDYHFYNGGGTELYNKEIINLIEPYLKNNKYHYCILSQEEIDNLNHRRFENEKKEFVKIKPHDFQQEQLNKVSLLFMLNNTLRLNWSCGLGKALMSVFIVYEMKFSKVLICVPSIYLQKQMENEILRIYPNKKNILKIGGINQIDIFNFIENRKRSATPIFIISTYNSCYMLQSDMFEFDLKIGDEAHHLVGIENEDIEKSFTCFHKIKSKKTLFMTATEKIIEKTDKKCYSMDDENVFGILLDRKTVSWAIENKKITDYYLLVLKNTEDEVNNTIASLNIDVINKELFISAYMVLKSIEKNNNLTHIAIYTNKTENAELVKIYIDKILETNIFIKIDKNELYNEALHSKTETNLNDEVNTFKNCKYGIISCVYIFGEGFDLPRLNGVCFAENMESDIRIVQCALRPNRLEKNNPNKKAYIIIPYIDYDDWNNDNKSFDKIRKIIGKLRNVDENIEQKIHILSKAKNESEKTEKEEICNNNVVDIYFEENENELLKLKLRLRHSKTLGSKFSEEQDEFAYMKQLNKELNIKSKEEYIEKRLQHKMYIPEPVIYFCNKGVWTDWYDFIGVETTQFIQSKQNWINFCKKNNVSCMNDYEILCDKYKELPRNPGDFYTHFTNIQNELGLYKMRR